MRLYSFPQKSRLYEGCTPYPNPCAYTDRFQEEYNALVVYLAVHYPDDKELSTSILTRFTSKHSLNAKLTSHEDSVSALRSQRKY
jgi:hypothetical protein